MPTILCTAPCASIADEAARYMLERIAPSDLPRAIAMVPTRRACVTLRQAFQRRLGGKSALLPRILPLGEIDRDMVALLGPAAFEVLKAIPPAMPDWQQRYLLARQVAVFERRRVGANRFDQSLKLAEALMALQDEATRRETPLTKESLSALAHGDYALHWELALDFLGILAEFWPQLEAERGLTTAAAREVALLSALARHWHEKPPPFPVFAIGSTASQPATARLLETIAHLPQGAVILPGLRTDIDPSAWESVASGHPWFHLKQFLDRFALSPRTTEQLGPPHPSIWEEALADRSRMPGWSKLTLPEAGNIRLVACTQGEEEARVLTLMLREAIELGQKAALVTPDEGLMQRVASHLARYGIRANRLAAGSLADTQAGAWWGALTALAAEPERLLHLRRVLHHPSVTSIGREYRASIEPYFHGLRPRRTGQAMRLPETLRMRHETGLIEQLLREAAAMARARLTPAEWLARFETLAGPLAEDWGEGSEAVADALEALRQGELPAMGIEEFSALLAERLEAPWRDPGLKADTRIFMLTPVEARLQHFDRVLLANFQDKHWPGSSGADPWLNLAARSKLGLAAPEERVSLMAHDVMMLGSAAEVFITWPKREEGQPTIRSRFLDRLLTLLAAHGIKEESIADRRWIAWADALYGAEHFEPAAPPYPKPAAHQRPARLPASKLDALFSDPYSIYARYVLGLAPVQPIDAEPEPSDFGSLTHRALDALATYWTDKGEGPNKEGIDAIADHALRDFSDQPAVGLFWRTRLIGALHFVNREEAKRRATPLTVQTEKEVEADLPVGAKKITLYGRIDRMEQGAGANLIDYKTGKTPKKNEILEGRALQLLAYAMLAERLGMAPETIEYWKLPQARQPGEIVPVGLDELQAAGIPDAMLDGLAAMLDESRPFLVRTAGGRAEDYDGISRYDEWAG